LISVISKIGAGDVPCPIAANLLLQTISIPAKWLRPKKLAKLKSEEKNGTPAGL
jgi:hypothetical protein